MGEAKSPQAGTIRFIDVRKSFREGRDVVLNGLNVEFPRGKLTYILGPSGVGKSVTLKHILGLLRPDSGEVWVGGKNMSTLEGRELAEHRKVFGMLFQNSALFDDITIFENVAFPLREHTTLNEAEIEAKVMKSLKILGIEKGFDKFPNELSGGMKKRVALARAIIREPEILLYDEPTTGLDPLTRVTVDELIETLKRELQLTSLVISHDIPSALRLADQIAFLHDGKFAFWGTPQEFKETRHEVIRRFLDADRMSFEVLR
ncbi:MAG: ABC transporter ATP-binding protein [Oligoflexia bacterium]|jgi:phospholipid/cholesterol/gamma-HCH transport system ATP-binding protein